MYYIILFFRLQIINHICIFYPYLLKLHNPLYIKLDGIEGEGVILKNNITNKNIMDEQDSSGI